MDCYIVQMNRATTNDQVNNPQCLKPSIQAAHLKQRQGSLVARTARPFCPSFLYLFSVFSLANEIYS